MGHHFCGQHRDISSFTKIAQGGQAEISTRPGVGIDRNRAKHLPHGKTVVDAGAEAVVVHQRKVAELRHERISGVQVDQADSVAELMRQYRVERGGAVVLTGGLRHHDGGADIARAVVHRHRVTKPNVAGEQIRTGFRKADIVLAIGARVKQDDRLVSAEINSRLDRIGQFDAVNKVLLQSPHDRVERAFAIVVHSVRELIGRIGYRRIDIPDEIQFLFRDLMPVPIERLQVRIEIVPVMRRRVNPVADRIVVRGRIDYSRKIHSPLTGGVGIIGRFDGEIVTKDQDMQSVRNHGAGIGGNRPRPHAVDLVTAESRTYLRGQTTMNHPVFARAVRSPHFAADQCAVAGDCRSRQQRCRDYHANRPMPLPMHHQTSGQNVRLKPDRE